MNSPLENYLSNDFCVLANPMRKMIGIVMKKAKNQIQLKKDNNGTG